MSLPVKLSDIEAASERLHPYVKHTPLLRSEALDEVLGCEVYFKPECLQLTGSFKIRGASNKILTMTDEEKEKGIIASSSGTNAPQVKVDNAKKLGAEVIQHGFGSIERYKKLYEIVDEKHYSVVHSFNDPMLIAGQGTVGYEIMQDLKDVDTVVVPLGGGGVLAGVATAVKSINPKCRVIGAEPERIPRYSESRKQGKPVTVELKDTLADGLMITTTGTNTYPLIEEYVDEIVPVPEYAIAKALNYIVYKAKVVVEPSAAIGVAALISGGFKVKPGEKVCFVLTGGNIDPKKLIDLTEC